MEGLLLGDQRAHPCEKAPGLDEKVTIRLGNEARLGHRSGAIAVDHRQHALRQIAEIIGEVAIEAADHRAMREIAVIAERQLAQHEIAQRVEPVSIDEIFWRDEIAERL